MSPRLRFKRVLRLKLTVFVESVDVVDDNDSVQARLSHIPACVRRV